MEPGQKPEHTTGKITGTLQQAGVVGSIGTLQILIGPFRQVWAVPPGTMTTGEHTLGRELGTRSQSVKGNASLLPSLHLRTI